MCDGNVQNTPVRALFAYRLVASTRWWSHGVCGRGVQWYGMSYCTCTIGPPIGDGTADNMSDSFGRQRRCRHSFLDFFGFHVQAGLVLTGWFLLVCLVTVAMAFQNGAKHDSMDGNCISNPSYWIRRVLMFTLVRLYCPCFRDVSLL